MPRSVPSPSRRLAALLAAFALAGTGCASSASTQLTAQVSDTVPAGTSLSVAVHTTEVQLKSAGEVGKLPFTVRDWPVVPAGPDVIQAFRAHAVDIATNAGIPPIQAHGTGLDAKIVAVQWKQQPQYVLATAPGSDVHALGDLRGKKIAFSPGQAQGVVVLRTLEQQGLTKDDVQLVELNSPQFLTSLQAGQVDVAPLAEPTLTKYLTQFGPEGARGIVTPAVDALTILWAPTDVLADPGKAAAIKAFIPFWSRSQVWAWENPDAWIDAYYVKDQQVSAADGRRIVDTSEKPEFPASWDAAIRWEQETVDLVSKWGYFGHSFAAADLFDRRFERVAADAVAPAYQGPRS
ncbi:ABC transporter substrate-binding protein [Amycolatopsis acidiphila]|uniref:PhnD/SsuA/transferrin family substrate-binding protein n=1 Tax=Amycolatopsis acidiphila TaxID=715473 RepID=A0A558A8C1_9PSEU|nr:PhnD/SsuA/transferrin family substrate-binding protein [Amycolatopsis acidiphila]TVT20514.1 PhnD/SsuA/transferrin family substrate-binding protein [Amycolatopsis acidiphila]UIJ57039.1 ABC transporter substrate-binding protein [Amycolatopsis acidiphila]GHG53707.1 sulfonate ABC transporter substrate-binding protein [Amycolatopsis acidiphila]